MPVLHANLLTLDSAIEAAFEGSRRLVVEVQVPEAAREHAAEQLVSAARYSAPDTLHNHLSAGTWESLVGALGSVEARDALSGFRPWFIALNLELGQLENLGADASLSLESHFLDRANGRAVVSLSTPEAQVRELQALDDALAERRLQSVLVYLPRMRSELEVASKAWLEGRPSLVARALDGRLRTEFKDVFARLWLPRCHTFARQLFELSEQPGNTFVVLDVALLVGEGAVLDELSRLGLRIEQL